MWQQPELPCHECCIICTSQWSSSFGMFHTCDSDGCEFMAHYAACEPLKLGLLAFELLFVVPTPVQLQLLQLPWQQVTVCAIYECQAVLASECERLITRVICLLRKDAPPRHVCWAPPSPAHAYVLQGGGHLMPARHVCDLTSVVPCVLQQYPGHCLPPGRG